MYLIGLKGVWTNRCRRLPEQKRRSAMYSGKHEVIMTTIFNQIPDLDPAELIQVADYIRELKLARKDSR